MADSVTKQPQPQTIFREIGGSGLNIQQGILFEEFQRELNGLQAVRIFTEMSLNNAIVGAILFTIEQMVQQVDWKINPFSDAPEDGPPKDYVQDCFDDMNKSWADTLSEICTMFTYGWGWHEVCYKMRRGPGGDPPSKFTDGKIGWRKWPLRGQNTLYSWEIDDTGGIAGMTQQLFFPESIRVTIPIQKSLLFRTRVEKDNPEGLSILRRAYRSYWYCKRFEEIEAIGIERDLAGLPVLTPPENLDLWNPTDPVMIQALSAAKSLIQSIRRGEREGVVKPFGWELELLSSGSRRQFDINTTIERYEIRIAMTCLADFIFLGQASRGSWALSQDKTRMFTMALGGFLRRIKEIINRHAIPTLLELNGMDSSRPPKLEHGDIETQDLQQLAQYLTALAGAGAVIFPDEALERHLRLTAGFPPPPEEPLPPIPGEPPPVTAQKRKWLAKKLAELREEMAAMNGNSDKEER